MTLFKYYGAVVFLYNCDWTERIFEIFKTYYPNQLIWVVGDCGEQLLVPIKDLTFIIFYKGPKEDI